MGAPPDHLFDSVVASVTLRARDPERLRAFYEPAIGLRAGSELLRIEPVSGAKPPPNSTGLFHTAFRYPDRASLGAAVNRTMALAPEFQGASDHGVSEAVYFADPEGNGIELYRDRPFVEWSIEPDGAVAMGTWPLDLQALRDEAGEDASGGPDIGHIHLMVADVERTIAFYGEVLGLSLRARFGPAAAFLADGGYHHHVGANTWHSLGGSPPPEDSPGLAGYELRLAGPELGLHLDPDGIEVTVSSP